jgi:hypothetical protein
MEKGFSVPRVILKTGLIGQILLKKGLISKEQLDDALASQKKEGGLLGNVLVSKGFISEEFLCMALASQSDLCFIPLEKYIISNDIARLIPQEAALKHSCIALEKIGGVLIVAMANPFDHEAAPTLETITHYKVVTVISAKSRIEQLLTEVY